MTGHPLEVVFDQGTHPALGLAGVLELRHKAFLVEFEALKVERGGKFFFAAEVVIDAADAGPGRTADVGDGGGGEALSREAAQGCFEDGGPPAERAFAGLPLALWHASSVSAVIADVKGRRR